MENKIAFHPKSSAATLPQFDLFSVPPTQIAAEEDIPTRYYPVATITEGGPIEFNVKTPIDEYINFTETYLTLKCVAKLDDALDPAGITGPEWKSVIPANYLMHSLISKIEVILNEKEITQAPQCYQYKAFLECLLSFTQDAKNTFLGVAGWNDKDEQRNARITPAAITETDAHNDWKSRTGREFKLKGRLHLDLSYTGKLMLGPADLKIRLFRSDAGFYMNCNNSTLKPRIEIREAYLTVGKTKAAPQIVRGHANALTIAPSVYPITRSEVIYKTIQGNSQDAMLDNIVTGTMPRRMFVGLIPHTTFAGTYATDPFKFKHHSVKFLVAYIDGKQYPRYAYTPNYAHKDCVEEYTGLYQALNQNLTDTHTSITEHDFLTKHCIYAFNFAPDLSDGPGAAGHVNPLTHGTLRMHIRFADATTEPLNVVMYMEYDDYIEVHNTRQVTTSFN